MVAQVTLDHSVWVRVLVPEPNGAMVKRLRRRPLKAKSRVRFPLALPEVNADALHQRFLLIECKQNIDAGTKQTSQIKESPEFKDFLKFLY